MALISYLTVNSTHKLSNNEWHLQDSNPTVNSPYKLSISRLISCLAMNDSSYLAVNGTDILSSN